MGPLRKDELVGWFDAWLQETAPAEIVRREEEVPGAARHKKNLEKFWEMREREKKEKKEFEEYVQTLRERGKEKGRKGKDLKDELA